MASSRGISEKWLAIVQARAAANGVPCDVQAPRMCLKHCGKFSINSEKLSGKVVRHLKRSCCHVGHTPPAVHPTKKQKRAASLYWLTKAQIQAHGVDPGSQMCASCVSKSKQDPQQENPVAAPRIRATHAERKARALVDFPPIDPNLPVTAGERECFISLVKKVQRSQGEPQQGGRTNPGPRCEWWSPCCC
jgi:hypothetical protein